MVAEKKITVHAGALQGCERLRKKLVCHWRSFVPTGAFAIHRVATQSVVQSRIDRIALRSSGAHRTNQLRTRIRMCFHEIQCSANASGKHRKMLHQKIANSSKIKEKLIFSSSPMSGQWLSHSTFPQIHFFARNQNFAGNFYLWYRVAQVSWISIDERLLSALTYWILLFVLTNNAHFHFSREIEQVGDFFPNRQLDLEFMGSKLFMYCT